MGKLILLSGAQFAFAERIASEREQRDRAAGIEDVRCYDDSNRPPDWYGAMGEVSACLAYGLNPLTTVRSDAPDAGVDFELDGVTFSVKTTLVRGSQYIVPKHQSFTTARGVLVWPTDNPRGWDVLGSCTREDFETWSNWVPAARPFRALNAAWFSL